MMRPKLLCLYALLAATLLPALMLRAQSITVVVPPVSNLLYLKWFQDYETQKGIRVFSRTIGSGRGVVNGPEPGPIDFGIAEAQMNNDELRGQVGILNLPIVAHAVAVVYNLPGLTKPLHLTGPIVANIYLGRITQWDDPQIARLNCGVSLPSIAIVPVHNSSGSGTTYVFTAYLSAISPDWKSTVGAGKSVHWPVGLGARQDAGMARAVPSAPGSIGYLEFSDAAPLPVAAIQNAAGKFVVPNIESTEAAASAVKLPRDMRGSIVNSPAPSGYPLADYFYVFVYKNPTNPRSKDLVAWMLTKGQTDAASFGYAPLPPAIQKQASAALIDR